MTADPPVVPDDAADRLAAAIAGLGVDASITTEGTLALLCLRSTAAGPICERLAADAALRQAILQAARDAGFTHAALELATPDGG